MMITTPEYMMAIGIVLFVFAIPALMICWIEKQRPRLSFLALIGAIALIVIAWLQSPEGFTFHTIVEIFVKMASRFL